MTKLSQGDSILWFHSFFKLTPWRLSADRLAAWPSFTTNDPTRTTTKMTGTLQFHIMMYVWNYCPLFTWSSQVRANAIAFAPHFNVTDLDSLWDSQTTIAKAYQMLSYRDITLMCIFLCKRLHASCPTWLPLRLSSSDLSETILHIRVRRISHDSYLS